MTDVPTGWKGLGRGVLIDGGIVSRTDGLVAIPYRSIDGETLRTRLFAPSGARWWGPDGEGAHLFGLETVAWSSAREPMLVCEGESDALAVRELLELRAVAAPGASIWKPEWSEYLDLFASLYVVGDGDAAGEAFVWRVCASLPWARPVVMPTGRDLRDLLQAGELERVGQLFDAADEQAWIAYAMSKAPDLETCAVWLGSST